MTPEMAEQQVMNLVAELQNYSPIRTGNLRYNAIRYERLGAYKFVIYVDEAVAPYMPFTNEPWISPRWHGKKNPNEGWFQRGAEAVVEKLGAILNADKVERTK